MISSIFSRPIVSITLVEDQLFVHPSLVLDLPTRDPVLAGTVLIELPTRRAISSVKVVLEGLADVCGGDGWSYESSQTLYKDLVLPLDGEVLEPGSHACVLLWDLSTSYATDLHYCSQIQLLFHHPFDHCRLPTLPVRAHPALWYDSVAV